MQATLALRVVSPIVDGSGSAARVEALPVPRAAQQRGRRCRLAGTARAVVESIADLGRHRHTVVDAVAVSGRPPLDDRSGFGMVNGLGLDETLFACHREQLWSTQIVDTRREELLDGVDGQRPPPCRRTP